MMKHDEITGSITSFGVPGETDRRPVRNLFRLHSQNTPSSKKKKSYSTKCHQNFYDSTHKNTPCSAFRTREHKGAQESTTHTDGVKGAPFRILHAPEAGCKASWPKDKV